MVLSLFVGRSSLGRRTVPLAVDTVAGEDLNADGAEDPEVDGTKLFEESAVEPPTVPLPEADTVFDADNGVVGTVSVRVEDSLDDGELVDRPLACWELSEDTRERLRLGRPGSGSAGGGELEFNPTRLVRVEAAVDGDLEEFEGGVEVGDDDDRVTGIDCPEAPIAEEAGELAPMGDDAAAALVSVRESEAARALSLDGTCTKTVL